MTYAVTIGIWRVNPRKVKDTTLPEKETLACLIQMAEHGIREKLSSPGIGALDVLADLPAKGIEVVHGHLVIRDLLAVATQAPLHSKSTAR